MSVGDVRVLRMGVERELQKMPTCLIETRDALASFVERALGAEVVALDTEFVWTRTYYPRLGVVQVALDGEEGAPGEGAGDRGARGDEPCAGVEPCLIDVPAVGDLSLLGPLLISRHVIKIVHDGQQDLTILRRAAGCAAPANIFDTRLASGFAGQSSMTSLSRLLETSCGISLEKTETRTDWLQRPLSSAQVAYALDDVRYLPDVRRRLLAEVASRDNGAWLDEELAKLDADAFSAERAPEEAFLRVKGRGRLDARGLAVLRALAAWREHEARWLDRPRGHVMTDDALLSLAKRRPETGEGVGQVVALNRRKLRSYGGKIAQLIVQAQNAPEATWPAPAPRRAKAPGASARADALIDLVERRAGARGVDPALVTSRSSLRSLAAMSPEELRESDHPLLHGWRRAILGDALDEVLRA